MHEANVQYEYKAKGRARSLIGKKREERKISWNLQESSLDFLILFPAFFFFSFASAPELQFTGFFFFFFFT